MAENIIMILTCWGCALLFWGIGIYSNKKQTPMWFWSGTTVKSEEVTDVKAYNKENAMMWKIYSLCYWISGLVGVYNGVFGGILIFLACFPGLVFLILYYRRIEKKYLVKYKK